MSELYDKWEGREREAEGQAVGPAEQTGGERARYLPHLQLQVGGAWPRRGWRARRARLLGSHKAYTGIWASS